MRNFSFNDSNSRTFSLSNANSMIVFPYYVVSLPLPAFSLSSPSQEGEMGGEESSTLLSFCFY